MWHKVNARVSVGIPDVLFLRYSGAYMSITIHISAITTVLVIVGMLKDFVRSC
jgi:hypothetical protein